MAQIIRRIAAEIFYVALKSTAQASISTSMSGKSIAASDQYPKQEIITDSAVEGEAQDKAQAFRNERNGPVLLSALAGIGAMSGVPNRCERSAQ